MSEERIRELEERAARAEADNAALTDALRKLYSSAPPWARNSTGYPRCLELSGAALLQELYWDVQRARKVLDAPHPGQPLLGRMARLERTVKAARELRRHVAPHPPEDFPEIEHICGGPNAVCDGECVEAAWMAEDNMAFHRFDAALAALDGGGPDALDED